jgi:hypothetical protein
MNKKYVLLVIVLIIVGIVIWVTGKPKEESNNTSQEPQNEVVENQNEIVEQEEEKMEAIKLKVNNRELDLELENNETVEAFVEKLKSKDVVVNANDYNNFEKVGRLGFSLPVNDTRITTEPGDIVIYQGNQVCLFYNSNSYSYTKLGKVKNVSKSKLEEILGNGNVTLVFTYVNNGETLYD